MRRHCFEHLITTAKIEGIRVKGSERKDFRWQCSMVGTIEDHFHSERS